MVADLLKVGEKISTEAIKPPPPPSRKHDRSRFGPVKTVSMLCLYVCTLRRSICGLVCRMASASGTPCCTSASRSWPVCLFEDGQVRGTERMVSRWMFNECKRCVYTLYAWVHTVGHARTRRPSLFDPSMHGTMENGPRRGGSSRAGWPTCARTPPAPSCPAGRSSRPVFVCVVWWMMTSR